MTKDLTRVQDVLKKLILVLDLDCSQDWKLYFEKVLKESYALVLDDEVRLWVRKITGVYGGMGSFNDLVLQKNWKALREENDILASLKSALLGESMKLIEMESKDQENFI